MNRIILILLLFVVSCDKKDDEAIARITSVLREDLKDTENNITNAIEILETEPAIELETIRPNVENILQEVVIPETPDVYAVEYQQRPITQQQPSAQEYNYQPSVAQEYVQPRPKSKSSLNVVQQESYIKVGNDRPGTTVSRNKSQKITVAIFPQISATSVDIYLYAVPTYSHLVRNYNTLIGYAKGIEFVQGQAQFTKHWRARRSDGRNSRSGKYNIYVEYQYKNSRGQIIQTRGRYWGGNHRGWTVRVL